MALPTTVTAGDTYTVTAYNVNTGVATVTFTVGGQSVAGVKVTGCPKDSVASVTEFMRNYANAYLAGKVAEANAVAAIDPSVVALLNAATPLV